MKKILYSFLSFLLVAGVTACNESGSSASSNGQNTDNGDTIIQTFEANIGERKTNTVTFKNPFNEQAHFSLNYYKYGKDVKIESTTCGDTIVNSQNPSSEPQEFESGSIYNSSNNPDIILEPNGECSLTYSFTPTSFTTDIIKLETHYSTNLANKLCPTPDAAFNMDQYKNAVLNATKQEFIDIYNYTIMGGYKSPEISKVDIGRYNYTVDFIVPEGISPKTVTGINIAIGEYIIKNASSYSDTYTLKAYGGCSINNKTLTVSNSQLCTLTVENQSGRVYFGSADELILLEPNNSALPVYKILVNGESDYRYSNVEGTASTVQFDLMYTNTAFTYDNNGLLIEYVETHPYVLELKDGNSATYTIEGTNPEKFEVATVKYDGCNVDTTQKLISIPDGKSNCYYTVDIIDKTENGKFNAVLNTGSKQYDITGDISLLDFANACKEWSAQQ